MIVIGVDPHKQSHTAAAVEAGTGELRGERTVRARREGHEQLARLGARARGGAPVGARGLPARLDRARALPARPWRAGGPRAAEADGRRAPRSARAGQVGRDRRARGRAGGAARAELPVARLAGPGARSGCCSTTARTSSASGRGSRIGCAGTCTSSTRAGAPGRLPRPACLARSARPPPRPPEQTVQVRIAGELVCRCRELTRRVDELERELPRSRDARRLSCLSCPAAACSPQPAGRRDRRRRALRYDAKLAMHAGAAPLPASCGSGSDTG